MGHKANTSAYCSLGELFPQNKKETKNVFIEKIVCLTVFYCYSSRIAINEDGAFFQDLMKNRN